MRSEEEGGLGCLSLMREEEDEDWIVGYLAAVVEMVFATKMDWVVAESGEDDETRRRKRWAEEECLCLKLVLERRMRAKGRT